MWAHSPSEKNSTWHALVDHLWSTAALARQFADPFDAGDLAATLGLFHDAGKASCEWQEKLKRVAGTGGKVGLDHKKLGTQLVYGRARLAALAVLGHHGGLKNRAELKRCLSEAPNQDALRRFFSVVPEASALAEGPSLVPPSWSTDPLLAELGIRMVFSALVDADHLDTGAHRAGLPGPRVAAPADMADLLRRFEHNRVAMLAARASAPTAAPVDKIRADLYDSVIRQAAGKPGVFRLPAPTGSGKTITSAGFALRHAAEHGKARVIVAVPFTTITEQNAGVYRRLLGADVVLEHHSNTELDARGLRLAAENWDAPFVVTTTVQLFDSLFGNMPARSRKLHRLANSVLVLDEVQALPLPLLVPVLSGLRLLAEHFHTTVLLASATQPPFEHLDVWRSLRVTELVRDRVELFSQLRRVRYEWWLDPRPTLAEVAAEIARQPQALAVVNTVVQARTLFRLVAELRPDIPVHHLSTRMYPLHRQHVLTEVRTRLAAGEPVLLVSTQLIEAGVDVDFPVVFRALAPAQSLQQTAGRANREGKRPEPGRVVVFHAADTAVPSFYRAEVDKTTGHFGPGRDPDDPDLLTDYYRSLYTGLNLDQAQRGTVIQHNRASQDFESVARGPLIDAGASERRDPRLAFRMIDEDPVPVVVTDHVDGARVRQLLDQVRAAQGPLGEVFRELRRYTVSIPRAVAADPAVRALCRPVLAGHQDLWEWIDDYDEHVGIDEGNLGKETVW
ncbi:CRISPR-associated helicase Cas3' [Goodfellowiella coeruleoviolacea]|uniref:CRISPR-associated endonuclease/helicase Cas3 n=1 Tax=Goodfellowiella coeruleoviolacea TaxID=334858 RepID=A0AAE3GGA1_9PSEU|nr:CRISPR-associated helicase Cas3' [Goodfellowiella coeruleoviolacea]MCP2166769.1 CRISPR-associated endonuclease/helicase Cas3 [Goodfellowiella coeruleoviolacea]